MSARDYPQTPFLAVSAAIFRNGRLLVARRGTPPMVGVWSFPGGGVELGETLAEAVAREVREEVGCEIALHECIGHSEVVLRDEAGLVSRHMVVACFAARWLAVEPTCSPEALEVAWVDRAALATLSTTARLPDFAARAAARLGLAW